MCVRVAVIGAGIVGSSIAYYLSEAGAQVVIVERNAVPSGTTSRSFAWANANQKTPRDYFELNYAGLREHYRLAEEIGPDPWFHPHGNLVWSDDPVELEERVARLRAWGYRAEWRAAADVNARLEANIRFPDAAIPVAYFPEEAWIFAPRLAGRMIRLAVERGAETRLKTEINAVTLKAGQLAAIRLSTGENLRVDAVVNAAGPDADAVARLVHRSLPLAPTRGLLVRLTVPGALPVGRVVHTPHVNLRPEGDDSVLIHHDTIDSQLGQRLTVERDDPLAVELIDRARKICAGLERAEFVESRIGTRPIPADGRSCVGAVAAVPGYFEAVTHSGVTLGPLLGRLLTREILSGDVDPILAPFRPDRFARD